MRKYKISEKEIKELARILAKSIFPDARADIAKDGIEFSIKAFLERKLLEYRSRLS